ncbi:MAG: alanine--tRNA ligase [Psychroflexus sp.]|nr:alanine--tRNA ligase [Psychroflexus sp.]MDR9448029.1 alanine--tRNA ligase [Psychroflexus sp.]
MTSQDIRQQFIDFFKAKAHRHVASAPMVLKNDPTLMFTNAGMNQFKSFFLGNEIPKHRRVVDAQKCLRVSGKHNDLEEVGKDGYHHTMFEMLGNWSFGDYFKKEAIEWAWEFLTDTLQVDKDRLYATVFEGDKSQGLSLDQEAYDIWKKIVPEAQIVLGDKTDNFWEMGAQGPCGPASEIHIDLRSDADRQAISGKDLVNQDHEQVIEIWNLVFIQFNRKADNSLEELPEKHIDTGMGFERLTRVLQHKASNYDTDIFTPIIQQIESITQITYGKEESQSIAIRVVADHLRAVCFAIADGQLPSNNGAGYVIRRILRRAIRYGFTFLNTKQAFIHKLTTTLVDQLGQFYPELEQQQDLCINVIREEEESFLRTLDQGLHLLDDLLSNTNGSQLSGEKAFELYDTYGFPIDLTALIAQEKGYTLDQKGFEAALQRQKNRSKADAETDTDDWQIVRDNDGEGFIGYDHLEAQLKITSYRKITRKKKTLYQLVFNKTPFYPEGGGQVGDCGFIEDDEGERTLIKDTIKENNQILHIVDKLPQNVAADFKAFVDIDRRYQAAKNHTATHLLHQALREILGTHVEQKGSLVHLDYLRFDFSHFSKVDKTQLQDLENFVNTRIHDQLKLEETRNIPYYKAIEKGAIALFGEKYGDAVRMITFGNSKELCGGTHVQNTASIRLFVIKEETSVASGIRRIEACTDQKAIDYLTSKASQFDQIQAKLQHPEEPVKAIEKIQQQQKMLSKEVEKLKKEQVIQLKNQLKNKIQSKDDFQLLIDQVDLDAGSMKEICFQLGGEINNLVVLLGSQHQGKALLSCYVAKNLTDKIQAGQIIKHLAKHIKGGGGGQDFFATAGGKNPDGIKTALNEGENLLVNYDI